MKEETIVQITAPHFCAGIIFNGNMIIDFAPILRWYRGRSYYWLRKYCEKKKWKFTEVKEI